MKNRADQASRHTQCQRNSAAHQQRDLALDSPVHGPAPLTAVNGAPGRRAVTVRVRSRFRAPVRFSPDGEALPEQEELGRTAGIGAVVGRIFAGLTAERAVQDKLGVLSDFRSGLRISHLCLASFLPDCMTSYTNKSLSPTA
jgi:hypothetical protein